MILKDVGFSTQLFPVFTGGSPINFSSFLNQKTSTHAKKSPEVSKARLSSRLETLGRGAFVLRQTAGSRGEVSGDGTLECNGEYIVRYSEIKWDYKRTGYNGAVEFPCTYLYMNNHNITEPLVIFDVATWKITIWRFP